LKLVHISTLFGDRGRGHGSRICSAKIGTAAIGVLWLGQGVGNYNAGMPARFSLITSSPDRLGGTPVFAGTRVPVQALLDYIETGDPLDSFLEDFPSVSQDQAVAVLELVRHPSC
jgi:uncharacterized protein (DUF433 family)